MFCTIDTEQVFFFNELMNYLDIILLIPLVYGLIQGIRHGIVKELSTFLALLVAIFVAKGWAQELSIIVNSILEIKMEVSVVIAYILIFIVVFILAALLANLCTKLLKAIMLNGVNRFFGSLFGILKYAFAISLIINVLLLAKPVFNIEKYKVVQSSVCYRPLQKIIPVILPAIDFDSLIPNK